MCAKLPLSTPMPDSMSKGRHLLIKLSLVTSMHTPKDERTPCTNFVERTPERVGAINNGGKVPRMCTPRRKYAKSAARKSRTHQAPPSPAGNAPNTSACRTTKSATELSMRLAALVRRCPTATASCTGAGCASRSQKVKSRSRRPTRTDRKSDDERVTMSIAGRMPNSSTKKRSQRATSTMSALSCGGRAAKAKAASLGSSVAPSSNSADGEGDVDASGAMLTSTPTSQGQTKAPPCRKRPSIDGTKSNLASQPLVASITTRPCFNKGSNSRVSSSRDWVLRQMPSPSISPQCHEGKSQASACSAFVRSFNASRSS
mmetsp:Transcript_27673/g.91985  ORF Transcript_27673/g.91985 Transcript_27673/m.91985 type:complete len:316 (-) Transcript_27673:769-1716(-)